MAKWHYQKDGQQHGPVLSQQLKELAASGHLLPTDLIWKEGMSDWVPASKLKGLFGSTEKTSHCETSTASCDSPSKPHDVVVRTPAAHRSQEPPPLPSTNTAPPDKRSWIVIVGAGGGLVVLTMVVIAVITLFNGNYPATHPVGTGAPINDVAEKHVETRYKEPAVSAQFASVNYTQGPNGEPLQEKRWTNQVGMIVTEQYYAADDGEEITHGPVRIHTPEGQILFEQYHYDGVPHGPHREWHAENGQLAIQGVHLGLEANFNTNYVRAMREAEDKRSTLPDDLRGLPTLTEATRVATYERKHGVWVYWYEDGTPSLIEHWNEGVHDGEATVFYKNGRKKIQAEWRKDEKSGRYFQWYETGELQEAGHYVDGLQDGEWTGWYQSGAQSFREMWDKGSRTGREVRWSEDGTVLFDKDFSGRSGEYIETYRGFWNTGRRLGESYHDSTNDVERRAKMDGYKKILADNESSRNDLIRQFGADNPAAQRMLGACDGLEDGFALGVKSGRDR